MQYFYIKKGSTNPPLRIELIKNGESDYLKSYDFSNAIQNADVFFTMRDEDGHLKISKQPCLVFLSEEESCEDKYIIEYRWNRRDVSKEGTYYGTFEIQFKTRFDENGNEINDLYEKNKDYPPNNLIVPIYEELCIIIK